MTILINDGLMAFWYIDRPAWGLDWRMALVRLPGGIPQLVSRVRRYATMPNTYYPTDPDPYVWHRITGRRDDSMQVGYYTGKDKAKEMSRRWRAPVFEAARGAFEPTEKLAARIQRDLFLPPPVAPAFEYETMRHEPMVVPKKPRKAAQARLKSSARGTGSA